jgi:hypothetical protein
MARLIGADRMLKNHLHAPEALRRRRDPSGAHAAVWFTGLSGTGNTTIARAAAELLAEADMAHALLDGYELRTILSADRGFSREDRVEQIRRVGHLARILGDADVVPLVALVFSFRADRGRKKEGTTVWWSSPCRSRGAAGRATLTLTSASYAGGSARQTLPRGDGDRRARPAWLPPACAPLSGLNRSRPRGALRSGSSRPLRR